jgi:hypothetical protein
VIGMNQRLKMHSHLSLEKRRSSEAEIVGELRHFRVQRVHERIMEMVRDLLGVGGESRRWLAKAGLAWKV